MNYLKCLSIALLLLAAPVALASTGGTDVATTDSSAGVKGWIKNHPKTIIVGVAALIGGGVYAAHKYSPSFNKNVSKPALDIGAQYFQNLKKRDPLTVGATVVNAAAIIGGLWWANKQWNLLEKLQITSPSENTTTTPEIPTPPTPPTTLTGPGVSIHANPRTRTNTHLTHPPVAM